MSALFFFLLSKHADALIPFLDALGSQKCVPVIGCVRTHLMGLVS